MLFPKKKKENEIIINPHQTTTLQSYKTKVIGDIVGHDPVSIDGVVEGCVIVDNIVIVEEDAEIKGKIQAYQVIVEGEVKGRIECDFLHIKKSGLVLANVEAREVKVEGKLQGEIIAYDLTLAENAFLGTKIQVNRLTAAGTIVGDIASDTFILKESAYVKGDIFVNIFMNEGAALKGEVRDYKDILQMRTIISPNQVENQRNLKISIEKYIRNSEYINEILKGDVDIEVKVNNLISFMRENSSDEDLLKVTRLINYQG